MNISTILSKFESIHADYEKALNQYTETEFALKPSEDAWSIGQMYQHLVSSLLVFHAKQVENCLASTENADKSKTMPGRISFLLGSFPPIKIKVPASPEYTPPQPANKTAIQTKMPVILNKMRELAARLEKEKSVGKTKHPALGYFNAEEWFRMIEMHFRHHLRQQKRIDAFLKSHK
jgi:hypothetical protein